MKNYPKIIPVTPNTQEWIPGIIYHSVLTSRIMNRKLPMCNSNLHDNPQTYKIFAVRLFFFHYFGGINRRFY